MFSLCFLDFSVCVRASVIGLSQISSFSLTVTVFENEGVSDDTIESVFQFLVRYDCIKCEKIKRLYACYMVKSWRFKMFL